MPVFLDTTGNSTFAIAICGRCSRKFPYRLPARQTENISLRFPRPDTPLNP